MPTYVYTTKDGLSHEWNCRMSVRPQALFVNGQVAQRDWGAGGQRSGDPWVDNNSMAMMVHPDDIPSAMSDAKGKGVDGCITFNQDGSAHFASRSDQKRYCRAYGFHNRTDYW